MRKNDLKKKLNSGKSAIGPFIGFPSPGLVEYMGWLGFDFVVIDCEHGPMDYETAENFKINNGMENKQLEGDSNESMEII